MGAPVPTGQALTRGARSPRPGARDRVVQAGFWGLLALVVYALLRPLWVGTIPALTDFGGHVQVAHGWIHVQDNPLLAGLLERRDTWLAPNLLTARFAALCYPWLDPITSLRLFVTLAGIALAGALVWVARVYDRPRWLVLMALPFFWGGMLGLGLLNYVAAYPLLFAALALGRLSVRRRHLGWTVALAALLVVAFWAHGIGFVYTTGIGAAAFVLGAPSWRRLGRAVAFLPGTALWLVWFLGGASHGQPAGSVGGLVHATSYHGMSVKASDLLFEGLDILRGDEDSLVFAVVFFLWVLLLLSSRGAPRDPPEGGGPPARTVGARVLEAAARAWAELTARPLLVITVAVAAGVAALPTYVRGVVIDARLVTPLWMLLMLLPRPRVPRLVAGLSVAAASAAALFLGHALDTAMLLFDTGEVAPLLRLLTHLPQGTRTECVGVDGYTPYFNRVSLTHNCNGLTAHYTRGFSGGGFAITGFNATHFRPGHGFPTLRRAAWQTNPLLAEWDYVIVRGDHWEPSPKRLERVASVQGAAFWADRWTLYRVTGPAQRPEAAVDLLAGRLGGEDFSLPCAPKTASRQLDVTLAGPSSDAPPSERRSDEAGRGVMAVRQSCAPLFATPQAFVYGRQGIIGARVGPSPPPDSAGTPAGAPAGSLRCPDGEAVAGLHGVWDEAGIRTLGLLCARPPGAGAGAGAQGSPGAARALASVPALGGPAGAPGGHPFRLACPPGRVAAGLTGRVTGAGLAALGVRCAPLAAVLAAGEPPRPPRFKGGPYTIQDTLGDPLTAPRPGRRHGRAAGAAGPPLLRGVPYTSRDVR